MADAPPGRSNTTSVARGAPPPGEQPASSVQATNESDLKVREEPNRVDSSSTQEPPTKTPTKRAKQAHPESCADLLRAVYRGKRKRLKPPDRAIRKMGLGPKLQPAEREELLSFAAQDRTLERTRELMLLSIERFDRSNLAGSNLAEQVQGFVREVLARHPAFQAADLANALRNLPEGPTPERAAKMLARQPFNSLLWSEDAAALKTKELDKCRVNAVCCLLLCHWEIRGVSLERINDSLRTSLWDPAAQRYESEAQKLRALLDNRDHVAAAISCSLLKKQAFDAKQQERAAREAEERAHTRVQELESKLVDIERQLETEKTQVKCLTASLDEERQAHKDDIAHSQDEYAKLQGRILNRLRREVSLLEDGLHALRLTPPKVHVMDDHVERALEGLKREMQGLRRDD